jgi:hypothetical protein
MSLRGVDARKRKKGQVVYYWRRRGFKPERLPDDGQARRARVFELNARADAGDPSLTPAISRQETPAALRTRLRAIYASRSARYRADVWDSCVYVIGREGLDSVKIGVTRGDPARRLAALQTGHPARLEILLAVPGGRDLEAWLHRTYAASRREGEWFNLTTRLTDHLERLALTYDLPRLLVENETGSPANG